MTLSDQEKQEVKTAWSWLKQSALGKHFGWVVAAAIGGAATLGYSPEDLLNYAKVKFGNEAHAVVEVEPAPQVSGISPEQLELIIKQITDRLKPPPEPAPAPQPVPKPDVTPAPPKPEPVVSELKIQITTEKGESLAGNEVQAGQVIRISAVNAGQKIGWQPVSYGEVHLIASTDGKEYFGYLTSGSWLQLGLTDFASEKQISMRVTCNQAPQPPPKPVPPDVDPAPKPPEPTPKPVPPPPGEVSLVVVHDSRHASVESSILMNSNVWQQFKKQGNEYLWVEETDNSQEAKKYKADLDGVPIPALLIYDKKTGKKLAAMPRPKDVEELKVVVYSYTGGED